MSSKAIKFDLPSLSELNSEFYYDSESGFFYHWYTKAPNALAYTRAGYYQLKGYLYLYVRGCKYIGSRVAWKMYHGCDPEDLVDHRNGDKHDTRITNLREADSFGNAANTRLSSNNRSGYKGVYYATDRQAWRAMIAVRGRSIALGAFSTPEEAHEAYVAAAEDYFGEFANPGTAA